MREQLQARIETLRREFEVGQTRLQELERQQVHLRETLLRISGAIQVLEEMLAEQPSIRSDGIARAEAAGNTESE
jgi:predicted nuclease with TOPRIM domain